MSSVYLVRHGQSMAPKGHMIGSLDYPLSSYGRGQAQELGLRLQGVEFEAIFASPMSRALETAQLIAGPSWPNIIVEPALKEISLGLWEGLGKKVVQSLYPDFWEARGKNPDEVAPPEGESFADLAKRVIPAFERIAAFGREGTSVLVVAHQGVNRVILARERGLNLSQILTINQPTCCLTLLRADR